MDKQAILEFGKRAAEAGVEGILSAATAVEAVARKAATAYNQFADDFPVPLPKLPISDAGQPEWTDSPPSWPQTPPPPVTPVPPKPTPAAAPAAPAAEAAKEPPKPAAPKAAKATAKPAPKPARTAEKPAPKPARAVKLVPVATKAEAQALDAETIQGLKKSALKQLCDAQNIPYNSRDTRGDLVARLLGEAAPKEGRMARPDKLPQASTLMKRPHSFIVELCEAYELEVDADATKRELIDKLHAAAGRS
jgi:outer membrane biosynthesis protein TonB